MALAGSKYINNEKISEVDIAVAKINSEEELEAFSKGYSAASKRGHQ